MLLDFAMGSLLLIIIGLFYESTIIFYVMLHIHVVIICYVMGIINNFWNVIFEFAKNPLVIVGYVIPFTMEFLFSLSIVTITFLFNKHIAFKDVLVITTTPIVILLVPMFFPYLQEFFSSDAKYNIYASFNIVGLLCNTIILLFGGLLGLKILIPWLVKYN
ncbi:hypothetical protein VKI22_15595 [Cyanobacterium aponinum UTEX 3221]|uniref:hypothetical protein n=1 Tax=Cyanobacterium aponinum TaxID=379064 RepID=UPI002B4C1E3C|nr:hypothetical protein [Cyanobacterium aponinum]WRL38025.1 hypothetical protein VKI22_15595 [Cyanobacterium aponinum UTEX 3221]